MTALYHLTCYLYFGTAFQSFQFVAAASVATLGGAVMAYVAGRPEWRYAAA